MTDSKTVSRMIFWGQQNWVFSLFFLLPTCFRCLLSRESGHSKIENKGKEWSREAQSRHGSKHNARCCSCVCVAMRFLHEGSPWDLRIGWKTCIQVLRQMLALGLNSKRCMEYDPAWGPRLMLRWCRGTLTSWFWLVSTWDQAQWSRLKENFHGSLFYRTGQRGASLIKVKGGCALPPNSSLKPSFNQKHAPSLRDHDGNSGTRKSFPRYNCAS